AIVCLQRKNPWHRVILMGGISVMLLGMAFSGTRTANVMIAAGVVMFILLSFNKKSTRLFSFVAAGIFCVLLYGPFYGNQTINRFRSSFIGSEDESFKVREVNRALIQPYIYEHPIGGGLGTSGAGGLMYSPGHRLAGFPPDSGYLKKALETGWIGLGIICFLYFTILKSAITGYFCSREDQYKIIFAGIIAFLFSFYVAEFAQDAIGQITDLVVYYPMIAIMLRLKNIEHNTPANTQETNLDSI
ncbi:MAG: O-antigen ligase family protein, partial [Chitinophagaceae bacterium]